VVVLSISKMPMMDLSRTAISCPMDRYIKTLSVGEGLDPPFGRSPLFVYRAILGSIYLIFNGLSGIKAILFPTLRIKRNIFPYFFIG
jgi:hypothetical protein